MFRAKGRRDGCVSREGERRCCHISAGSCRWRKICHLYVGPIKRFIEAVSVAIRFSWSDGLFALAQNRGQTSVSRAAKPGVCQKVESGPAEKDKTGLGSRVAIRSLCKKGRARRCATKTYYLDRRLIACMETARADARTRCGG